MAGAKIGCIGECMIELSQIDLVQGATRLGFACDTLNTSVYLSRLGCVVSYTTNRGTDAFSTRMLHRFAAEGINCSFIGRHDTRLSGLCAIENDPSGERSFRYWSEDSAARTLFSGVGASLADLKTFDVIFLTGIILAILLAAVRMAFIAVATDLTDAGKQVLFDTNHRPRLWPDKATARARFDARWAATSLALPSYDDEERLYPGLSPSRVIDRISGLEPDEVALKSSARGPMLGSEGALV